MKKFKYSLNKLLNMRLRLEKEASQKFADIGTKIKVIDENINRLNHLYRKNNFAKCTTRIEDIIRTNYGQYLENSIELNKKDRKKLEEEYEHRLEDYKDKKKNRKVLENLRDKEFEDFLREQDKEEQSFLDELSINMYYKEFEGEK